MALLDDCRIQFKSVQQAVLDSSALLQSHNNNNNNDNLSSHTDTDEEPDAADMNDDRQNDYSEVENHHHHDWIIPASVLVQLFPDELTLLEAQNLLEEAGVAHPLLPVPGLNQNIRNAVQSVVDSMMMEVVGDNDELLHHVPQNEQENLSIECPCCCETVPTDQFVSCRLGNHWYCKTCVQQHARALVFGAGRIRRMPTNNKNDDDDTQAQMDELECIAVECSSTFTQSSLMQALDEKELERYGELQAQLGVAKAHLEDLQEVCIYATVQFFWESVFSQLV